MCSGDISPPNGLDATIHQRELSGLCARALKESEVESLPLFLRYQVADKMMSQDGRRGCGEYKKEGRGPVFDVSERTVTTNTHGIPKCKYL